MKGSYPERAVWITSFFISFSKQRRNFYEKNERENGNYNDNFTVVIIIYNTIFKRSKCV